MSEFVQALDDGIFAIDTGFQRDHFDAAYLLVENSRAAFIDCGTNHAVPRLLAALQRQGLEPNAVDWVIPTHVHLDHAGGAGLLMQSLPTAKLLVHPRGVRHMVDPSALYEGALAVYGEEEMQRSYGQLVGVPAERVIPSEDGMKIVVGGRDGTRELLLLDTPGHARHHHCIWDAKSRGWFTGDTFGLSYREFDTARGPWIMPTSTPVQFDPEALETSVARMLSYEPTQMFLTHYSRVGGHADEVQRLAGLLLTQARSMAETARSLRGHPMRHAALKEALLALYLQGLATHGCTLSPARQTELLAMDVELNAQGLGVWLDRRD